MIKTLHRFASTQKDYILSHFFQYNNIDNDKYITLGSCEATGPMCAKIIGMSEENKWELPRILVMISAGILLALCNMSVAILHIAPTMSIAFFLACSSAKVLLLCCWFSPSCGALKVDNQQVSHYYFNFIYRVTSIDTDFFFFAIFYFCLNPRVYFQ